MMKTKILTMLRESEDYVSGQQMCDTFGVSRTAVWKAIGQLKKDGYEIEALQNRGYKLIERDEDCYQEADIKSRLQTKWIGKNLFFSPEMDSTNIQAKHAAEQGASHGSVFVTDQQTLGKGRRGRSWVSPPGNNIYFSVLLRPNISPDAASQLTLVMALAIVRVLNRALPAAHQAMIKWPNDTILDQRKVTGILTEMSLDVETASISYVVIGTGINVKKQEFAQEIVDKAGAIEALSGQAFPRGKLLADILNAFEECYEQFMETGDLSTLAEEYNAVLLNKGKQVRILDPKGEFEAVAQGIDENGRLCVTRDDGRKEKIYAGEVSVRGLHGYL